MTDKELLELAAKAAGIELWHEDVFINALTQKVSQSGIMRWNPLTDDGDALRLAVKLGLTVCISAKYKLTWADKDDKGQALSKANFDGDPYAATRRAIVRAAAEIGKAST